MPDADDNNKGMLDVYCSKCGQPNADTAKFCASCGSTLSPMSFNEAPPLPHFQSGAIDRDAMYRAFIGPNNQYYYLTRFQQFDLAGKAGASWHWPAFFVTWYWLLYRKMWLAALIYFLLPYLIMSVVLVLTAVSPGLGGLVWAVLCLGYLFGIFVWCPLYANALYYKHCQKKMLEAKASSPSPETQLGILTGTGGTSGIVLILIVFFAFIFLFGILAAISLPAYQDYTIRAKVAEALIVARPAETAVAQYYQQQEKLPATLADAGFSAALPRYVAKIELDERADGTIAIQLTDMPHFIQDQKIYLIPSLEANKSLSWKCTAPDIKDKYLPAACREPQ